MLKTRLTLTPRGWSYVGMLAFILAAAVIRNINLLYVMTGVMLGPLLFSLGVSYNALKRIRLTRRLPTMITLGETLMVELVAQRVGRGGDTFGVWAQDRVLREPRARSSVRRTQVFYSQIKSGAETTTNYQLRLAHRGCYRLGPIALSTSLPLGLIRASATARIENQVLVAPRLGRLLPGWTQRFQLRGEDGQKSVSKRGKTEGDFYGMRDWRRGDSRNWIHWRTSAKRNKLTVRQFEQAVNQDLAVVLDLCNVSTTATHAAAIERAISFAATLTVQHAIRGSSQLLVTAASLHPFLIRGTSSAVFRKELFEKLAMVEPRPEDTLAEAVQAAIPYISNDTQVVLVTTGRSKGNELAQRLGDLWHHPSHRWTPSNMIVVDVTDPHFSDWFEELH